MKDLLHHAISCMEKLDHIRIPYGNILQFKLNTRAKKRFGNCKKTSKGFVIEINSRLLEDGVSDKALEDTLIHEILHTCPGCMNHGTRWKIYAEIVNQSYGYHIKRSSTLEEKGLSWQMEHSPEKYAIQCCACGKIFKREKMSSIIKYPEKYRCKCGGELQRIA